MDTGSRRKTSGEEERKCGKPEKGPEQREKLRPGLIIWNPGPDPMDLVIELFGG
jgi:hypothetical protein